MNWLEKKYHKRIDLSINEKKNSFLEGTGSLVLDRINKIAFSSLSERTSTNLVFEWTRLMNYQSLFFSSFDKNEKLIYHTNVMFCLADKFAIVCLEAIQTADEKRQVKSKLEETNHEIIEISKNQLHHFCANCLQLQNKKGELFLIMSDNAFNNFLPEQLNSINNSCRIIHTDLNTIEKHGGGSARCMIAELF